MSLLKEKLEYKIEEAEFTTQKTLSRLPKFARWILIVSILGAIPIYFLTKIISQKIWQGKYRQYVTAAKFSFENPAPPKISDVTVLTFSDGVYAGMAAVSNENVDLSLDETIYHFGFYNHKNELVFTSTDKFFLLPNQKKYIIVPRINTPEKIVSAKLELPQELPWKKRLDLPQIKLTSGEPAFYRQTDPPAFAAEGNFLNNSPYNIGQVRLTFLVKSAAGNVLAVSQRDEFTLKPYERRSYKQLWPGSFFPDAASVLVLTDTNTLDTGNLTLPEQTLGPASDLDRPTKNPF